MATYRYRSDVYSIAALLTVMAWARENPDSEAVFGRNTPRTMTGAQWRRWFRWALHRKINVRGGIEPSGRKASSDYWYGIVRLAHKVNTPRLIVREREVPEEYRARLAHRLTKDEDL